MENTLQRKKVDWKARFIKASPLTKIKSSADESPTNNQKHQKKSNKFPHVWSRLSLKGLKVLKTRLLSNRKRILVLEKKTLLGTQIGVKIQNLII